MNHSKITFIGAGNLARAIITGMLSNGYDPKNIYATNHTHEKLDYFAGLGINTSADNNDGVRFADVVVLSVKPQQLKNVCEEIKATVVSMQPLVVSIAAGMTTELIEKWLAYSAPIVCTMPNMPAMVGAATTALFANPHVSDTQKSIAESIFRAVGATFWLAEEQQLLSVVALSGSGPAYFLLMMKLMQQKAESLGFTAEVAELLAKQTAFGAAKVALESEQSLSELIRSITSSKGTTEQALRVFESGNFAGLVDDAIAAARERAKQIMQTLSEEE